MSDKIEYSRLLLKRSGIPGEVPTFTTGTTLNEMIPTDLFVGEMYLNTADDLMWVRTDNGILPIALSGMTGTTIPTLLEVLGTGNITGGFDIYVSSGTTIQYEGLNSGSTTTILGLDASGNTITTSVAGATQDLDNVLSYGNSTGAYNIVVSSGQTIQYQGLNNGSSNTILALDTTGGTITTSVSDNDTYITGGTITYTGSNGTLDLFDNSGSTISITGLTDVFSTGGTYSAGTLTIDKNDGTSFNVSGLFIGYTSVVESLTTGTGLSGDTTTGNITIINTAPDQVVSLSGGTGITTGGSYPNFTITNSLPDQVVSLSGGTNISVTGTYPSFAISATGLTTPTLSQVLTQGNTTSGNNIIVSTGDTIQSPNGENEIFLQSSGNMGLQSIYTLGGNNITEQIKMRAASGSDAGIEIQSYDSTNLLLTKSEYRPSSIKDLSFDSGGSFVETRLESSGFTIDLSNTSAGYLTIDGLLPGTATDLLGIDSNNRVVPYTITASTDYFVTGGTFSTSGGTLTLERQNGSVSITGFTANQGCFGITIDGAGSAITTGIAGSIIVPYACIIDCWGIIADQSGSIVVDVWKGSSPLSIPTSASDSIAGSEKPTLSSQQINTDLNLTTWTKNLAFGDVLVFNVDSASTVERVTLQIKVIKL